MATPAEINRINQLIINIANEFASDVERLFTQLFDQLSQLENPTRAQMLTLFLPIKQRADQLGEQLQTVLDENIAINSSVLGETLEPGVVNQIQQMQTEVVEIVNTQIQEEQTAIISQAVLGAVAGGLTAAVLSELRSLIPKITRRIQLVTETAVRQFEGAVTLVRTQANDTPVRYRYVGGVIAESREFCRQMNGRVLTEEEIRSIWSSQEWAGKRPGDPFVVRGGYNCRHSWVPVADDE